MSTADTYSWPQVPGAAGYRIEVRRNGRPIYTATTTEPELTLPPQLHLAPGRYTWSTTPVAKHRPAAPARPVVEEVFTVS